MSDTTNPGTDRVRERIAANVRAELARHKVSTAQVVDVLGLHKNSVLPRLSGQLPFMAHEITQLAGLMRIPVGRLLEVDDPADIPRHGGPGFIGPTSTPGRVESC